MSLDNNADLRSVQQPILGKQSALLKITNQSQNSESTGRNRSAECYPCLALCGAVAPVLLPLPIDPNKTFDPNKNPVLHARRIP